MLDTVRHFLEEVPKRNILDLLRNYGYLNVFSVWLAAMAAFMFIVWVVQRRSNQQLLRKWGIPGPESDSLLFGHYMTLQKKPIEAIHEWTQKYGPVFGYYIGEAPVVAVADAEIIRDLFVKCVSVFNERPPFALEVYPIKSTILCLPHDHWKTARSVLSPAFSAAKLKIMMNLINDSVKTTVKVIQERSSENTPLCFFDLGQKLTLDVIARCALATKINCIVDDKDKLLNQVRDFLANTETIVYHLAHGLSSLARLLAALNEFTPTHEMMLGLVGHIEKMIKQRKQSGLKMDDMLQLMMDAAAEDIQKIDDECVAANAFLFLIAGYETTAITIANASYLIAIHPEEQEKLFDEISEVCESTEDISYEQVQKLKRLEAFLLETLRLFPPVISFVSRIGNTDVQAGGFTIPKGTRVQASVLEVHMNPKYWPEPELFNPDRFIDTNAAAQSHYLPFGIGPKTCIGRRFSLLELKVTFATLIRAFRMKPSPQLRETPKRKPLNISLSPEGGVPLLIEPRN